MRHEKQDMRNKNKRSDRQESGKLRRVANHGSHQDWHQSAAYFFWAFWADELFHYKCTVQNFVTSESRYCVLDLLLLLRLHTVPIHCMYWYPVRTPYGQCPFGRRIPRCGWYRDDVNCDQKLAAGRTESHGSEPRLLFQRDQWREWLRRTM